MTNSSDDRILTQNLNVSSYRGLNGSATPVHIPVSSKHQHPPLGDFWRTLMNSLKILEPLGKRIFAKIPSTLSCKIPKKDEVKTEGTFLCQKFCSLKYSVGLSHLSVQFIKFQNTEVELFHTVFYIS